MKKRTFIDDIRVKDPCTQAWDEMVGNDTVRFCEHCAKDVNNLSAMTRKEALRLVRKSNGSLCIRYVPRPQTNAPMFLAELTQITGRRSPLVAAGVIAASLSLASLTYAQGGAVPEKDTASAARVSGTKDFQKADPKPGSGDGTIHGTVLDPVGAVIPGIVITLNSESDGQVKSTRSEDDGTFQFDGIKDGSYSLTGEGSSGFETTIVRAIVVVNDRTTVTNIEMEVSGVEAIVGDIVFSPEFKGDLAKTVANEDVAGARESIARDSDVNGKEEDGTTPLHIAVENGNLEMIQLLLDAGAKINARNNERETPLMKIDEDASAELVRLLVRYGAKINRIANNGDTALTRAAGAATAEVTKELVGAGAQLDLQNSEGKTALMQAAAANELETVRVLVLAGANVNLKDTHGETAWDKTSSDDIEKLLESYGADVGQDEPIPHP